jgi:hypothetical protein
MESRGIHSLNFSGLTCMFQSNTEKGKSLEDNDGTWMKGTMRKKQENFEEAINSLKELIKNSTSLQHLDLTNFLLEHHLLKLTNSIRESTSLLSVHLGQNNLSLEDTKTFLVQLGIDYRDLGVKLANQTLISDHPSSLFLEKE